MIQIGEVAKALHEFGVPNSTVEGLLLLHKLYNPNTQAITPKWKRQPNYSELKMPLKISQKRCMKLQELDQPNKVDEGYCCSIISTAQT